MATEIYLIRHGKTPSDPKGKILPDKVWDSPLSEQGFIDSIKLWDKIPSDIRTIYCPRFKRFTETVDAIRTQLPNIKTVISYQIEGIHFGALGGLTWKEVGEKYSSQLEQDFKQHRYDFKPYGGESCFDVNTRLMDFIDQCALTTNKIVIVTSGGITRAMYKMMHDQTFDIIPSGTVHKFDYVPKQLRMAA